MNVKFVTYQHPSKCSLKFTIFSFLLLNQIQTPGQTLTVRKKSSSLSGLSIYQPGSNRDHQWTRQLRLKSSQQGTSPTKSPAWHLQLSLTHALLLMRSHPLAVLNLPPLCNHPEYLSTYWSINWSTDHSVSSALISLLTCWLVSAVA